MTDVVYDMDNLQQSAKPSELETVTIENRAGIPQSITREISYTTTKAESYSESSSMAIDVAVEVLMAPKGSPVALGQGFQQLLIVFVVRYLSGPFIYVYTK